jgi:hypothetical protein
MFINELLFMLYKLFTKKNTYGVHVFHTHLAKGRYTSAEIRSKVVRNKLTPFLFGIITMIKYISTTTLVSVYGHGP